MNETVRHRFEDERLVRGAGRFLENRLPKNCLWGAFVRAQMAHARLAHVDVSEALAAPGVHAVLTGADLVAQGVQPLDCLRKPESADGKPFHAHARHALAPETVRFVGEAVALVVAETPAQAVDAAEQVLVDYEELPVETDPARSTDVAVTWALGDREATDAAFARARHVVSLAQATNRIATSPLETRSALAHYDPQSQSFTLTTQTQGVHLVRDLIAATLGIAPQALRVVTEDVGGSFGMKLVNYPEQTALLAAARRLGQPVAWVATRSEAMLADVHAREHASTTELALDAQGRFLALRLHTHANLGAYASALALATACRNFSLTVGNVYRIPALDLTVRAVYTNTAPTDAMRGAGKPESVHLMERLVDKAAATLGMDRVELRRRNLVTRTEMPYRAVTDTRWQDADFEAVLDRLLREADHAGFAVRREASAARGLKRGFGLGLYLHVTGGSTAESATVTLAADGHVVVRTGSQNIGQGHETGFAQIVAERLGIAADAVELRQGDSADLPERGSGTGGSSSLQVSGVTMLSAADAMIERLKPHAAEVLEAAEGDIAFADGAFHIVGTDRALALPALAERMGAQALGGCVGAADFSGEHITLPNGAYACEVEVDPETGAATLASFTGVDDVGRRINEGIVAGQLHGGIAQGVGQALLEHIRYDETGQLVTGSLMDYALPRADDLPAFSLSGADLPARTNPLGVKGVGEVGCIGAPGAVMSAVCDAIGTQEIEMPATPERVWQALQRVQGAR